MIICSTWDKAIIILGIVQRHEDTVHPPRSWFKATRRNSGRSHSDRYTEAYTEHRNYSGQYNWLNVSTYIQKFVGIEATALYFSSNWSFLSTEAERGRKRCSVLHCHTCMVSEMFLPEALKQWEAEQLRDLPLPGNRAIHVQSKNSMKLWFFLVHKQYSCFMLPRDNKYSEYLVHRDKCTCTPSNLFFLLKVNNNSMSSVFLDKFAQSTDLREKCPAF